MDEIKVIDIENYNPELSQETVKNFDKIVFQCEYCHTELSLSVFLISVAQKGVIFLFGPEDGYVGITCPNPNCNKTTLQKKDWQNLLDFKKELFTISGNVQSIEQKKEHVERIVYYSIPYQFGIDPIIEPYCHHTEWDELFNKPEYEKCYWFPDDTGLIEDNPGYIPFDGYVSYYEDDRAKGPAMEIWFFKKEGIGYLLNFENNMRKKIFPRYYFYDQMRETIDSFCWRFLYKYDYLKSHNEYKENDLFDGGTITVFKFDQYQLKVKKNYEFLNLLANMIFSNPKRDFPSSFLSLINYHFYGYNFKDLFNSYIFKDTHPQYHKGISRMLFNDMWKNFTKDDVQDLLSRISDTFIAEHMKSSQIRDFSFNSLWNSLKVAYDQIETANKSKKRLVRIVKKQTEYQQRDIEELEERIPEFQEILSQDYNLNKIKLEIDRISKRQKSGASFLLLGESGTGKELFAKAIHKSIGRSGPCIPFDCGRFSKESAEVELFGSVKGIYTDAVDKAGIFEEANGGTIFFDEVGNLSIEVQKLLLRVLQDHIVQRKGDRTPIKTDINIIFASNKQLLEMCEKGEFYPDLYYRFEFPQFNIPPLRERKADIPILVEKFIDEFDIYKKGLPDCPSLKVSKECMKALETYEWKGNIRELNNVIKEIMYHRENSNRADIDISELPIKIILQSKKSVSSNDLKFKKGHLPKDNNVLIQLKREGKSNVEIAKIFGVSRETVSRRISKMRNAGIDI